jgi:hypothetical protein
LPGTAPPAKGVDQGRDRSLEMLDLRVERGVVAPVLDHAARMRDGGAVR